MGVSGLWHEIEPACSVTTWSQLSDAHFRSNSNGSRGLRVGVDMSIWLFHAQKMKTTTNAEGEIVNAGLNADLRCIFYRVCGFLQKGILAVFVFDGALKPGWKRGKHVGGSGKAHNDYKKMFELMGMEWRVAAGEAEAELAAMNERGEIDAVLSDDVDNFLFGAQLVIRNPSKTLSQNQSKVALRRKASLPDQEQQIPTSSFCSPTKPTSSFPSSSSSSSSLSNVPQYEDVPPAFDRSLITFSYNDILSTTGRCREDMILIALMSGGDYSDGIKGCGPTIARRLAEAGYGRKLLGEIKRLSQDPAAQKKFLRSWREEVADVLVNNPEKLLEKRNPALAKKLLEMDDFPNLEIVRNYANPKVSRMGSTEPLKWERDIDLGGLVEFASEKFEWGHEQLLSTFRNNVWLGILLRQLRRTSIEQDENHRRTGSPSRLIDSVINFKCGSSTDFTPSYSLHLKSAAFDSLLQPHLPRPDPFPFPHYDLYSEEETERVRAERTRQGRALERPKPPGTSDFRHWVPAAFVSADQGCRDRVKEWKDEIDRKEREKKEQEERKAERARAKAEGRASPVKRSSQSVGAKKKGKSRGKKREEDSDEEDAMKAIEGVHMDKVARERQRILNEIKSRTSAATDKGKGKEKGQEKAKAKVPSESTKPIQTLNDPESSDLEIVEKPSTSRARPNKAPSPLSSSDPFSSFTSTKSSLPTRSKKSSPPSSTLTFGSSKSTVTIPPKRRIPSPLPSSDTESDSNNASRDLSANSIFRHVDKTSRRSITHDSPSKPKPKPSRQYLELSSAEEEEDLETLEEVLSQRQQKKKPVEDSGKNVRGRATKTGLGTSSSKSCLSSTSSKGKKEEKGKKSEAEVEVMVLSD